MLHDVRNEANFSFKLEHVAAVRPFRRVLEPTQASREYLVFKTPLANGTNRTAADPENPQTEENDAKT